MKKLLIISHPQVDESTVQSFLLEGLRDFKTEIELVILDKLMDENQQFDVAGMQEKILSAEELFLQFPLYWYSAPSSMSLWQEQIFTNKFVEELSRKNQSKQGSLTVITSFSDKLTDFQAGTKIGRSLSELLSPFEAFAHSLGYRYETPFLIDQFNYKNESQQMHLLINYLLKIEGADQNFLKKGEWLSQQLNAAIDTPNIQVLKDYLDSRLVDYADLDSTLLEIKNGKE